MTPAQKAGVISALLADELFLREPVGSEEGVVPGLDLGSQCGERIVRWEDSRKTGSVYGALLIQMESSAPTAPASPVCTHQAALADDAQ